MSFGNMLNIQEKISDSSSFDEIRKAYSNDFLNRLCDNFNERWDRQASCQSQGEENGEGSGILGKITAGIHAVSETIQDIVNIYFFSNFLGNFLEFDSRNIYFFSDFFNYRILERTTEDLWIGYDQI